jgi:signal transduction histidine kinase
MKPVMSAAQALEQGIDEVMLRWEKRAVSEVASSLEQTSLVLRNSLPALLESLVSLLSNRPGSEPQIALDAAALLRTSRVHGRSRAEIPAYVMSQVIEEYHILREVLFEVLAERGQFSHEERERLTSAFEQAVNIAATEFALVQREIQDQFMLSIAHDLRNPITAAQLSGELVLRSPGGVGTGPLVEKMIGNMKRVSEMIETIHDASRVESGHKLSFPVSECDLDQIARDVAVDMKLVYGGDFQVDSEGRSLGDWNPEYLRRVIENLVSNAAKYRAAGTPVSIRIRKSRELATIEVHNFGEPIASADLAQLFGTLRWKSTGRTRKGWGLGLALTRGIVDAFGGSIRAASSREGGTTFTVTLPIHAQPAVREAG